jgi:hypothetical protein
LVHFGQCDVSVTSMVLEEIAWTDEVALEVLSIKAFRMVGVTGIEPVTPTMST